MKSLTEMMAFPAAPSFTEAADIHLLFMAGLVFLAGIAGVGSVILLLLLAPFLNLALTNFAPGRRSPKRKLKAVTAADAPAGQPKHDDGGERPPKPRPRVDEAALGDRPPSCASPTLN